MTVRVDLQEFRSAYLAEVDEHLTAANHQVLELEGAMRDGTPRPRALRELMRLLHTIKGLSSMVSLDPVVDVAHEMESLVRAAEQAGTALDEPAIEALVEGLRAIGSRVAELSRDEPVSPPPAHLLARLRSLVSRPAAAPAPSLGADPEIEARLSASERQQLAAASRSGRRAVRVDFAPSPRKAETGLTITSVRERLSLVGDVVRVMPLTSASTESATTGLVFAILLVTDAPDEELARLVGGTPSDVKPLCADTAAKPPALDDVSTEDEPDVRRPGVLRVEVARVDDAIEKLASLVVTQGRLRRATAALAASGVDTTELDSVVGDAGRQLRDLRSALLSVRMVPLSTILDRLPLLARRLGRASGKQARLLVQVGDAELDKTVAEQLFPAFVQFVRNAVDHGIEPPEQRRALGKPEEGTVTIRAAARGNRFVEIRIEDDGAGIDGEAVAARAGLVEPPRSNTALLEVLCRSGFSTRDAADHTSGRGVGMDIAKRTIERLGGELTLETRRGRGTTFVICVPLTIAVVDAFTVSCAGELFAVPVPVVSEILEVDPESLPATPYGHGRCDVRLLGRRGSTVALVDLASVLGLPERARGSSRQAVVVRRSDGEVLAFAIDRVLGQQEAVIRPLVDPLLSVVGVSGSTDLGDGKPTLVLDLVALSGTLGGAS